MNNIHDLVEHLVGLDLAKEEKKLEMPSDRKQHQL